MSLRDKIEALTRWEPGYCMGVGMDMENAGRYIERSEVLAIVDEHDKDMAALQIAVSQLRNLLSQANRKVTCEVCRDTHRMWLSASERHVMCTYCPRPCQLCRSGPFCAQTPCPCKCHKQESGR